MKKRYATDFDPEEAERVFAQARAAVRGLRGQAAAGKADGTADGKADEKADGKAD